MSFKHYRITLLITGVGALVLAGTMSACAQHPAASISTADAPAENLLQAESRADEGVSIEENSAPVDDQVEDITIEGKWKATGEHTWGIVSPGSIVIFNGQETNIFSPKDTYAFYEDGGKLRLDLTGALGGNASFTIKVVDDSTIELTSGGEPKLVLRRVQ